MGIVKCGLVFSSVKTLAKIEAICIKASRCTNLKPGKPLRKQFREQTPILKKQVSCEVCTSVNLSNTERENSITRKQLMILKALYFER